MQLSYYQVYWTKRCFPKPIRKPKKLQWVYRPRALFIPAVILSPKAITTLMSCGCSSYTLLAGLASGGNDGQVKEIGG